MENNTSVSYLALVVSVIALCLSGYTFLNMPLTDSVAGGPQAPILPTSSFTPPAPPSGIGWNLIISGTVETADSNSIVVKVQQMGTGGVLESVRRTIGITSETKITLQTSKDPKLFQAELEAHMSELKNGEPGIVPPMPYEEKEGTFSDITEGANVFITLVDPSESEPIADSIAVLLQ